MIREPKNIDFMTTGRQPSEEDFALVSEWIKKRKEKEKSRRSRTSKKKQPVSKA
jgi:hypothetical protein